MAGDEAEVGIVRAIARLAADQDPSGELPSHASPLGGEMAWERDHLSFVTAQCVLAIAHVPEQGVASIVDAAVAFLWRHREGPDLWRYWAADHERRPLTPPDADDTACCSMAVATRGVRTDRNRAILEGTAAPDGRFHTWLIPRPGDGVRIRWALRAERRPEVRRWREELWTSTEASPDDIDAVVNANVCRYLGPAAPREAAGWVASVARSGDGTEDKWYRRRAAVWGAVADGARRDVPGFRELGPSILAEVSDALDDPGVRDLDLALGLSAVLTFEGSPSLGDALAAALIQRQGGDGGWHRDLIYFGGPQESFGWGSEALVTAEAIGALSRWLRSGSR